MLPFPATEMDCTQVSLWGIASGCQFFPPSSEQASAVRCAAITIGPDAATARYSVLSRTGPPTQVAPWSALAYTPLAVAAYQMLPEASRSLTRASNWPPGTITVVSTLERLPLWTT